MAGKRKIDKARGERIRYVRMEKLGLRSQERFAEVIAAEMDGTVSRGAVGNWEQGKEIGLTSLRAISKVGRVPLEWLTDNIGEPDLAQGKINGHPDEHTVPLVGYVGAGAAAHFYAVAQGELDRVPAPAGATASTVATEIRGDSVGPLFNRWLVYYDDVRSPVTPDMLGRLCVVGLFDDRVLVKQIARSKKVKGMYDLISNSFTEPPIEGVEIMWAAKVTNMVPR